VETNREMQAAIINETKINSLYTLLEDDVQDSTLFTLSKEQLALLDKGHALCAAGKTQSYSLEEAKNIIRGN